MKTKVILIAAILFLSSCVNPPANGLPFKYGNDCLPQAVVMTMALKEKKIEADVLLISTPIWKHAGVRYMYPVGQNSLFFWDHDWKSIRLRAWKDDPYSVANAWMKATRHSETVINAEFLK